MEYPILRYPDPTQGYIFYTDASGIGWSGVLTQEHKDDKGKTKNHPICYVSGQFRGSQLNWAALTKEAYAIYMSIRRLSFYMTDAHVTIRSDHLPLKKFLNKQTMNSKVNNWAVELEQFKVHLQCIPGSWNLLADSLSRLLDVTPDPQQPDKPEHHEFGSYCFEELEPAKILETISTEMIELQTVNSEGVECSLESWESPEVEGVVINYGQGSREKRPQVVGSKSNESSQNSQIPDEIGVFNFKYEEKTLKNEAYLMAANLTNLSKTRRDTLASR